MTPTAGSLFSGVGGFDLGLERAGFEVRWQCDNDRFCRRVLDRHWPQVKKYGDIREVNPDELEPVDLICGGFPCQDLSVAGKRKGLAGERSGLFFEFLRIVATTTPRWVLIENVPGLLSSWCPVEPPPYEVPTRSFRKKKEAQRWADSLDGRWEVEERSDFAVVVSSLADLGYGVAWRIFDAQYDGLAQRRERVFIVGSLGTMGAVEVLFESDCLPGNPPPVRETRPGGIGDRCESVEAYGIPEVCGSLTGGSGERGWQVNAENAADGQLVVCGYQGTDLAHAVRANASKADKPSSSTYIIQDGGRGADKAQNGLGISEDGPCYTLDGMSQHAIAVAPTLSTKNEVASSSTQRWKWMEQSAQLMGAVRRLTPVEYARLQGFPDDWCLLDGKTPDSPQYKAYGNAVWPDRPEWIGERMKEAINRG